MSIFVKEQWNNISHPYHSWLHSLIILALCWLFYQTLAKALLESILLGIGYELIWDCWLVKYWRHLKNWLIELGLLNWKRSEPKINGFSLSDIAFNFFGAVIAAVILLVGGWPI